MALVKPQITIPTGYEQLQRAAASKRKLAETMLSQGLAPDNNMQSWAQVLGHWAQTWAGKSMQKDADKMDTDVASKVLQDYQTKRQALQAAVAGGATPQQITEQFGNEPLLAEDLKPYSEAFASGLKQNGELTNFGGRMVRKGDVVGQYANDPNKMVFVNPDGSTQLNPVAVTAAGISSGNLTPTGGYQTTGQMPGMGRLVGAMGGQPPAQQPGPQQGPLTAEQGGSLLQEAARASGISGADALRVRQSMGPGGQAAFGKWLQDNRIKIHVSSPQEASQFPSGTPLILPDGTEGRVP